jgi:hypothetical protein
MHQFCENRCSTLHGRAFCAAGAAALGDADCLRPAVKAGIEVMRTFKQMAEQCVNASPDAYVSRHGWTGLVISAVVDRAICVLPVLVAAVPRLRVRAPLRAL